MEPRLAADATTDPIDFEFLDEPTLEFAPLTTEELTTAPLAQLSAVATTPAAVAAPTTSGELLQFSINEDLTAGATVSLQIRFRGGQNMSVQCLLPAEISYAPNSTLLNGRPVADQDGACPLLRGLPLSSDGEGEVTLRGRLATTLRANTFLQLAANLLAGQTRVATLTCFALTRGAADFTAPHACRLNAVPLGSIKPGDIITYTFTINNQGSAPASNIVLYATPPRSIEYVPNSTCWEGLSLADVDGGSPLFTAAGLYVGTVGAGQASAASFQVRVLRPLDNGSELTCEGRVMRGQETLVAFFPVGHSVISAPSFERSAITILDGEERANQVQPGETLRFSVAIVNSGDGNAYESRLSLSLPPPVECVADSITVDGERRGHDCGLFSPAGLSLGTLEAAPLNKDATAKTICFEGRLSAKSRNSARLDLNGTVWARNCPPRQLGSHVAIQASPRLQEGNCTLTVSPTGLARPGDVLTYRATLENSGNAPATYAVLRASLPAEALYLAGTTSVRDKAVADEDGTGVMFGLKGLSLGEIERGEKVEISFRARIITPLSCGTVIQARASLSCAELPSVVLSPVKVEVTSSPSFTSADNYIEIAQGSPAPGSTLQYILHFRNNGDADAQNVILRSDVPEHALLVSRSTSLHMEGRERKVEDVDGVPALFSDDGLSLGTVKAGQIGRVSYSLRIKRPLADGTHVPHAVSISCDGARFLELMAPIVTVSSAPVFSGEGNGFTVSPATNVAPGEKLTYTLRYRNGGGSDAAGVVLRVVLPPQSTLIQDSISVKGQIGASAEELFADTGLPLRTVGVDEGGEIRFQTRVHNPLDSDSVLECHASVDGPIDTLSSYRVESIVKSKADFNEASTYLSATPQAEVAANHIIQYVFHYHNTGNAKAYRLMAFLEMSERLEYIVGSTTLNGKPMADVEGNSPLLNPKGLFIGPQDADIAGEIALQARVTSPIESGTLLQASGTLEVGKRRGVAVVDEPPVRFTLPTLVHTVISYADFNASMLEVSPSGATHPGQTLHYTLKYRNGGTGHASDVLLFAQVPQHTTQNQGSFHLNGLALSPHQIADLLGNGLRLGKVSAGEGGSLMYDVSLEHPLDSGTVIKNRARITTPSANGAAELTVSNAVASHVDFSEEAGSYVRASVDRAAPGDAVLYTIHLANSGDMNASGVVAKLQLGSDLSYVPDLCTLYGVPVLEPPQGDTLLDEGIDVGDIAVGAAAEITFTVRVNSQAADGASLGVEVETFCQQAEPSKLEAAPLRVSAPYDFVDSAYNKLDVYPTGDVSSGQLLTYTLAYGNRGTGPAPDVVLRAVLPAQCSYMPGTTFLNGEIVTDERDLSPLFTSDGLQVGTVAPGAYGDVVWQLRVDAGLANGTPITCAAKLGAAGKHAFTTNSTHNTVRSLVDFSEPDGALLEVSPADFVEPRDTLTYTFHYHNKGNAAATDVSLSAALPPHTSYLSRSTRLNGLPLQDTDENSPLLLPTGLALPRIEAGESGRVTVRLQVDGAVPSGTEIPFQMELRCLQGPPVRSNKVSNGVVSFPRFIPGDGTFLKSYPSKVAPPGQVITFVLYYQNRGSTEASALIVSAREPRYTSYVARSTRVDGVPKDDVKATSPVLTAGGLRIEHVAPGASGTVSIQLKIDDEASDESMAELQVRLSTEPATTPTQFEGKVLIKCRREAARRVVEESPEASSEQRRRRSDSLVDGDEPLAVTDEQMPAVMMLAPPPQLPLSLPAGMTEDKMDKSKLSQAYCDRGSAYARRGYFENAVQDYDEAIRLNPANPFCYYNRGMAHLKMGNYEKAVEDYSSGIQIRPSDGNAYNNLGNAYNKLGRQQEAIDAYTDATRLNPRQGQIYLNRGLVYSLMGNADQAAADFAEVARLSPHLVNKIPPGQWSP